jgi:hypothetical protein
MTTARASRQRRPRGCATTIATSNGRLCVAASAELHGNQHSRGTAAECPMSGESESRRLMSGTRRTRSERRALSRHTTAKGELRGCCSSQVGASTWGAGSRFGVLRRSSRGPAGRPVDRGHAHRSHGRRCCVGAGRPVRMITDAAPVPKGTWQRAAGGSSVRTKRRKVSRCASCRFYSLSSSTAC